MRTTHVILKIVFAIISAIVGGSFGSVGGQAGTIVGVVSGLIVGYYYAHFTLNIKDPSYLVRIRLGTSNGTLAGLISGVSVHVPSLFIRQTHGMFSGGGGVLLGAIFGAIIGTVLGLIGSSVIAFIPREDESK